jgi:hypothetical protein
MPLGSVSSVPGEASQSAVSWPAIFAGAFAAFAITDVLLALAVGLGLTSVSPWSNSGVSATTFTIMTGLGLIVVQWLSAAIGGYMAGRLRTKWVSVHAHEVFFRDTAHGFLAWALATVVGALFLALVGSSIVSGGVHAVAGVAGGATQAVGQAASNVSGYDIDSLFRSDKPDAGANPQAMNAQASRILASALANGEMPAADKTYLANMISARTGISQDDAQKRVDGVIAREKAAEAKAKEVADATRKATAEFAIFSALSMLIGAFIASASAALGGSLRDDY